MNAYRFSVSWSRIIPDGDGKINEAGLKYYSRLVDALLASGIEPFITLYHWDLPQALQEKGGWANRSTIDAYVRYVNIVVSYLGDRVHNWMTHNEPWCVSICGNQMGVHAPGLQDTKIALAVAHNLLVSHGLAVPVIREKCPGAKVGIVLNFCPADPATDSPADAAASQLHHERFNLWFLNPLTGRGYPQTAWKDYGDNVPEILDGDMDIIRVPIDFLGINFYSRTIVHDSSVDSKGEKYNVINRPNPNNMMARGWEVYPETLVDLLNWLHNDYGFPELIITENGATYDDVVWNGEVHDITRQDYIRKHLEVLPGIIQKGIPLTGYFCWSLMDNFEWAQGTRDRFGLIYVDFETKQRIIKDSGKWFARVASANKIVD
jgi:beta-glucosidase